MNLTEMKQLLDIYVDDVVPMSTAVPLFNSAQNKLASASKANFPQFSTADLNAVPVFPVKYHEALVLYAAAMMKAQDSSIREKDSFMGQFMSVLTELSLQWDVPPQYKDDPNTQQFIATAGQTQFTITDFDYSPENGDLVVYVGDTKLPDTSVSKSGNVFTIYVTTPLVDKQPVSAVWEMHADLDNPPYSWWSW